MKEGGRWEGVREGGRWEGVREEGGEKGKVRRGERSEEGEDRWEGAQCEHIRSNIRKVVCVSVSVSVCVCVCVCVCVYASCARVCMLFHCYSSYFRSFNYSHKAYMCTPFHACVCTHVSACPCYHVCII